jgi:hypothetical protein
MGINPADLNDIENVPESELREWLRGQKPESRFYQAAKYELERRKEEKQQKRDKEASYRSWLSILIALGSLLLALLAAWFGWFHR